MARIGDALQQMEDAEDQDGGPNVLTSPQNELAIGNLWTYFGILPDSELIEKIAGFSHAEPASLPLFLTGLRAMENPVPLMPLPLANLTYVGPWITWVGV
jgi:hypothetical protein